VSISVHVECYSSYTYAEEPRALEWNEQVFEVMRIVKRWRTPTGPVFRVEVTASKSQISRCVDLHYLELEDRWTMSVRA
jgi:hypothetical protein